MDVPTVITSAAVGAVVAAVVNLVAQRFERRARRSKALLLTRANELAVERVRFGFQVAQANNAAANVVDPSATLATYYRWLTHLLESDQLPSDAAHQPPPPGARPQ